MTDALTSFKARQNAANLSVWFRYALDSRIADIRQSAQGPQLNTAKTRGFNFWRLGANGCVAKLLQSHYDPADQLPWADPWAIERDLVVLLDLCRPLPHVDACCEAVLPSDLGTMLATVNAKLDLIAAELQRQKAVYGKTDSSSMGGMAGVGAARLLLRIQAEEIQKRCRVDRTGTIARAEAPHLGAGDGPGAHQDSTRGCAMSPGDRIKAAYSEVEPGKMNSFTAFLGGFIAGQIERFGDSLPSTVIAEAFESARDFTNEVSLPSLPPTLADYLQTPAMSAERVERLTAAEHNKFPGGRWSKGGAA